ncbi:glycerophosphodiester phosphodiesterase family protein [Pararhizobium sp. O133]|uniref:glycerophosphodiester phosphodiesterase family protein n=1 Tax=Pararhizobium sp. O133 TaxID=3449278 RepID=UPI003F687422
MVRIIGHRGAAKLWPENTLAGFERALQLPLDGIEFDVHRTADGELVVIHDGRIDRTTNGSGLVCDMTLAEIRAAGIKDAAGQTVPMLREVLDLCRGGDQELQVEIKTDAYGRTYPGLAGEIADMLREFGMVDRSRLTSFVPNVLTEAYRVFPSIRYLASINQASAQQMGGLEAAIKRFAAIPTCAMAIHKDLLSFALDKCIELVGGDRIGAWVPNTPDELAYWMRQPILQVTTDRPDVALRYR